MDLADDTPLVRIASRRSIREKVVEGKSITERKTGQPKPVKMSQEIFALDKN
jgi:hypothetical protein